MRREGTQERHPRTGHFRRRFTAFRIWCHSGGEPDRLEGRPSSLGISTIAARGSRRHKSARNGRVGGRGRALSASKRTARDGSKASGRGGGAAATGAASGGSEAASRRGGAAATGAGCGGGEARAEEERQRREQEAAEAKRRAEEERQRREQQAAEAKRRADRGGATPTREARDRSQTANRRGGMESGADKGGCATRTRTKECVEIANQKNPSRFHHALFTICDRRRHRHRKAGKRP